jgi:SSS family solute:Na+ symporter
MLVVSYSTAAPSGAQLTGLTYATITADQRSQSRRSWDRKDLFASATVLLLIAAAYVYFTG